MTVILSVALHAIEATADLFFGVDPREEKVRRAQCESQIKYRVGY